MPTGYQPTKAELRQEIDMPGWFPKRMSGTLLGPVWIVHDDREPS